MQDAILTVNAGSSSVKFALFAATDELSRKALLCEGEVEGLGDTGHFIVTDASGAVLDDRKLDGCATHAHALTALLDWIGAHDGDWYLMAAGHRVVHGGAGFIAPVPVTPEVLAELRKLTPLAPLHQPHNLAAIEALARLHPGLAQVACFDTAFHHGQAEVATSFGLPWQLGEQGVRRYGFHGISLEYIAGELPHVLGPEAAEGRIVVAHLGGGASLTALRGRKSIATTMGLTPLDGLVMATRCGAIDPGVLLYLLQDQGMSAEALTELLYNRSGLLGLSGVSDDMRELLASDDARAKAAIDLFVYRIGRELGSLAAALGGLDALIFTGGIGEHAAEIRRRVCADAGWLGIVLDESDNARGLGCISQSTVSAWVIRTDEDLMIARHTREVLHRRTTPSA